MSNISDVLFITQLLVCVIILLIEFYNVMSSSSAYDARMCWILFVGWIISWFIGLVVVLNNPETMLYHSIFNLETGLWIVNIAFLTIQLFFYMSRAATGNVMEAYNSLNMNPRKEKIESDR